MDTNGVNSYESNLQRQILHKTSTVGQPKVKSAVDALRDINPHVTYVTHETELTPSNALSILSGWDVAVDGSDNFPTKYLINDACRLANVPWVHAAILRFEGQLSVFNYAGGPDYRDFLPEPPHPDDVPSCAEGGVVGVLPGVMGTLQAAECIKILLQRPQEDICSGRVLAYDSLKATVRSMGLTRARERVEAPLLSNYGEFCRGESPGAVADDLRSLSPRGALEKLSGGWSPYVLDVRLETEHAIVALPFTDRVVAHREVGLGDLPRGGDVLVYCKAGVRGEKAIRRLIELGADKERFFNLEGGIMGWRRDVDSTMPKY